MNETNSLYIAIAGNPNSGKSTLFNELTGLRQKVANYPGKTVEKHVGVLQDDPDGNIRVIDLPGTYSLNPHSPDEEIAHDVLMGWSDDTPRPGLIVAVVDASNLERNLFLVTQLLSLGIPVVVALNMMDACRASGIEIDVVKLEQRLGVPVVPTVGSRREGTAELKARILSTLKQPSVPRSVVQIPDAAAREVDRLAAHLKAHELAAAESAHGEALRAICTENSFSHPRFAAARDTLKTAILAARNSLAQAGYAWYAIEAEAGYQWIETLMAEVRNVREARLTFGERADYWLTHRIVGPAFLGLIVLMIFVSIFALAKPPMDWIKHLFGYLAVLVVNTIPAGPLQSLLTDGVITGVGGIMVFLPQIMMLFFFIAILEDSGYTARAALIMDRIMGRVGLHGRAFIPLFSSFACAVPGVMATRMIDNARDRLLTIFVAPFMCCSARWPVYLLLAGAVIPNTIVLGFIPLPAIVLVSMILLGIVAAVATAALFNKTILKGVTSTPAMELPRYRRPRLRMVLQTMWERSLLFVKKAGTVILAMSIIMWALTNYPHRPDAAPDQQIKQSFAGTVGRVIEPVISPIGFDWRIGVSILSSFVAREVFVSSMATIYGTNMSDPHRAADLQAHLRSELDPETGLPFFTPLRALSIMIFYVLSMQCVSTIAVVRRETNSWKWTLFQLGYMTGLAWIACFVLWQGGRLLGWS